MMLAGRDEITERQVDAHAMKAAAHTWFVQKDFYWKIGGMNEKYFGYGAEDQDFWERGMHVEKCVPNMYYTLKHTYHHFHPKNSSYPLNDRRVALKEETMQWIDKEIDWLVRNQDKLGRDIPFCDRSNWQ
jgi:predicted glycosyltransferase involved in capsule biosynthesis